MKTITFSNAPGDALQYTEQETERLISHVGFHKLCHGGMYRVTISSEQSALTCYNCAHTVLFPTRLSTYAKLREFFERLNKPATGYNGDEP